MRGHAANRDFPVSGADAPDEDAFRRPAVDVDAKLRFLQQAGVEDAGTAEPDFLLYKEYQG